LDNSKVKEYKKVHNLTINTHCPGKWAFVDMETGDIWMHKSRVDTADDNYTFYSVNKETKEIIKKVLNR